MLETCPSSIGLLSNLDHRRFCRLKETLPLCAGLAFPWVHGDHSCHAGRPRDPLFPEGCCYLGVILGLFPEDGLVTSLSGGSRPRRNPLGICVENCVLEIVGLDSGSGVFRAIFHHLTAFRTSGRNSSRISWSWFSVFASAYSLSKGSVPLARTRTHPRPSMSTLMPSRVLDILPLSLALKALIARSFASSLHGIFS